MSTREYCVYNETRSNLVASRVSLIDTRSNPLQAVKVLIEGLSPNADTGLWLNPLKSIPAVPRLSAYDLVYLDHEDRVVHCIELAPDDEVPPIDGLAASALLLPLHSFTASQAQPGDRVLLQPPNGTRPSPAATPAQSKPAEAQRPEPAILAKLPSLAWSPGDPGHAQPSVASRRRFRLLHALTHLRIHIQISIAFAPSPVSPASTPQPAPVPADSPATALHAAAQTFSAPPPLQPEPPAENSQPSASAEDIVGDGLAKPQGTSDRRFNSLLRRRWRSLRAAYLRWADSFVFYRPHTQPAYSVPRLGRNLFHFIFPR